MYQLSEDYGKGTKKYELNIRNAATTAPRRKPMFQEMKGTLAFFRFGRPHGTVRS